MQTLTWSMVAGTHTLECCREAGTMKVQTLAWSREAGAMKVQTLVW